jgi:RNA polymerase primary sigma factor
MRYLNGSHVYSIDISDDDGTSSRSVLVEPQSDDDTQEAALSPIGFEFIRDKIFSELSERERDILLMRFGLGEDKKEHTLDEIGKKHNLTRQRIKEILNELIPKCERIVRRLRLSSN